MARQRVSEQWPDQGIVPGTIKGQRSHTPLAQSHLYVNATLHPGRDTRTQWYGSPCTGRIRRKLRETPPQTWRERRLGSWGQEARRRATLILKIQPVGCL